MLKKILMVILFWGINFAQAMDSYNPLNKELTIPSVMVGNTVYNNVVVTVDNVIGFVSNTNNTNIDVYTSVNQQLFIPAVSVGNTIYNNVSVSISTVLQVGESSAANVVPVTVSGGYNNTAANMLTTSVTLCIPNSSNCTTIDNVQVDTGSTGLRVLASQLNDLNLNPVSNTAGTYHECAAFADGVVWGKLALADIRLGTQVANNMTVQLINDNNTSAHMPNGCSAQGVDESSLAMLAANGILGVGLFLQDCGSYCVTNKSAMYYTCKTSTNCSESTINLNNQVSNPVAAFATNNNGVVLQIPNISANGASNTFGNLIFGINTQSNNTLDSSAVSISVPNTGSYAGNFSVQYRGANLPYSFIDSGSSGYYFNDPSIQACASSGIAAGFYCPGDHSNLSLTTISPLLNSIYPLSVYIGNAEFLFATNNGNYAVFNDIGGSSGNNLNGAFDFGLSFFFGKSVFTGFEVKNKSAFFAFKAYP
jgi:hypothetical protein